MSGDASGNDESEAWMQPALIAQVLPEWVDYNGHMNVAYYVLVFDQATDAVLDRLGLGEDYRARSGCSIFVGDMRVRYLQEAHAGDKVEVRTRLLANDAKRLLLFHEMRRPEGGAVVAENEVLCVHVDLGSRRSAPWPDDAAATLARVVASQAHLPRPSSCGRPIGLPQARPLPVINGACL